MSGREHWRDRADRRRAVARMLAGMPWWQRRINAWLLRVVGYRDNTRPEPGEGERDGR